MILSNLKCYDPKIYNGYLVPCGRCYACKLKKSNDWSIRLHQEYLNNNGKALFVTLTYDDICLNFSENGLYSVLSKRDVQLFHKRLRHKVPKLNYFLVGEYGPTTLRPHYHAVYFGIDMSLYDYILQCWDKGFCNCSLVTDGRIAYVAKYSLLPQSLPEYLLKKEYKPFMVCSKGMGINYCQTEQVHRMHNADDKLYYNDNGYKKSLPRYYRDKLFSEEKRKKFAEDYKQRTREYFDNSRELQKNDYAEFKRQLKRKYDWIKGHSYDVENRLLKKPKL